LKINNHPNIVMSNQKLKQQRFVKTIDFFKKVEPTCHTILDLGVQNELSSEFSKLGYKVENTKGEDLDLEYEAIKNYPKVDVVTAFEILEHLVSPFTLLQNLPSNNLVATVPLNLWFGKTYRNLNDKYDWHYHEFEDWQFDMLLNKAGWEITHREKWTGPTHQIGFRPLLRYCYPRFYAVHAIRKS
jgi:hypothetical protein